MTILVLSSGPMPSELALALLQESGEVMMLDIKGRTIDDIRLIINTSIQPLRVVFYDNDTNERLRAKLLYSLAGGMNITDSFVVYDTAEKAATLVHSTLNRGTFSDLALWITTNAHTMPSRPDPVYNWNNSASNDSNNTPSNIYTANNSHTPTTFNNSAAHAMTLYPYPANNNNANYAQPHFQQSATTSSHTASSEGFLILTANANTFQPNRNINIINLSDLEMLNDSDILTNTETCIQHFIALNSNENKMIILDLREYKNDTVYLALIYHLTTGNYHGCPSFIILPDTTNNRYQDILGTLISTEDNAPSNTYGSFNQFRKDYPSLVSAVENAPTPSSTTTTTSLRAALNPTLATTTSRTQTPAFFTTPTVRPPAYSAVVSNLPVPEELPTYQPPTTPPAVEKDLLDELGDKAKDMCRIS